jgi:DNA-binding beta-propeller fold protein YncE
VTVIDGTSDSIVCSISVGGGPLDLCHNPDQNRIYVANAGSSSISVIRTDPPGLAGDMRPLAARRGPTIVRNVLDLQSLASNRQPPAVLLDASGRRVLDLAPGANDVSALAAGAYYVVSGNRVSSRVVILRRE